MSIEGVDNRESQGLAVRGVERRVVPADQHACSSQSRARARESKRERGRSKTNDDKSARATEVAVLTGALLPLRIAKPR
jgi:hypothetical protein